jgi:anti-sigma factor RsiW
MRQHHHHTDGECQELLQQLNAYVDGELVAELCQELQQHLDDCPDCEVVFETLSRTVAFYRNLDEEPAELPADVEARLFQRLSLSPCSGLQAEG